MFRAIAAVLLLTTVAAGVATGGTATPSITATYPNPVADGDAGEFVTLSLPQEADLGRYALTDGEATVPLPNVTAEGRVTLSTAPNRTRPLVEGRVLPLPDSLALANAGERLRLRTAGRTVDAVRYVDAPEGKIVTWSEGGPVWEPLGATDRPVVTAESGPVTAFTLPDSPGVVFETLRSAEKRILLAGYTYTSPRVTDALIAAARRGVTVEVLVDAEPVGGLTRREARLLDRLTAAGVNVTVLGGPRARYDFHHAKYAVVDSRALVTTENWKPAGVGGNASRGWGVVTAQRAIVDGLTETFRADAGWRDGRPWTAYRTHRQFEPARSPPANGTYPSPRDPERVRVQNTHLLVAPDNAEQSVRRVLAEADDRILVEQVSLGGPGHPFVRETIEAAQRGVHVRILLSGAWYAREENQRLADRLNERAEREELPLSVRIADPRGRFEKIHAKGVVVDDAHALVGSLNWNNNSLRENREVALLLEGEGVGNYYVRVFEADWRASGDRLRLRIGLIAVVGLAALLVVIRAGRIRFEAAE